MVRRKTSIKHKKSMANGSQIRLKKKAREYNPSHDLLDEHLIAEAIWECLKDNDPEGVIEILEAHFSAKNKSKVAREYDISRTTIYHAFKGKNPTLNTLAKLVHAAA